MKLFHRDPHPQPAQSEKEQDNLELTEDQLDNVSGGRNWPDGRKLPDARGGRHEPPSPKKTLSNE